MIQPSSIPELLKAPIADAPAGKKPIRVLVYGVEKGVESIVHLLHILDFAEVGEWSEALPSSVQGEVIRILTRYIMLDK